MTKEDVLEQIDHQILRLMVFGKDLGVLVQTVRGDEISRKIRHVQDSLANAQRIIELARAQTHEIGSWE